MSFLAPLVGVAATAPGATMAGIGAAGMLAGTGLTVVSSIASGAQQSAAYRMQAQAARYNQAVAEQNAQAVEKAGEYAEEQQRKKALRLKGAQEAAIGGSGVLLEGTPLEIMAETAATAEQERLAMRYNYAIQAARFRSQGNFYGYEAERQDALADYPLWQGGLKAGTALLTTGAGLWGNMSKYPKLTVPAWSDYKNYYSAALGW